MNYSVINNKFVLINLSTSVFFHFNHLYHFNQKIKIKENITRVLTPKCVFGIYGGLFTPISSLKPFILFIPINNILNFYYEFVFTVLMNIAITEVIYNNFPTDVFHFNFR